MSNFAVLVMVGLCYLLPTGSSAEMKRMHRREFIGLAAGALAFPLAAAAQQGKMPRIGILVLGNPDPAPFLKEFREGLRELGYVEGQNIVFEFRSAKGSAALLQSLAHELVALKVDIIVGFQTPAATAAKQATADIPVIINSGDPVGTGLVASLARPGGNITGVMGAGAELGGKNLELVREVLPSARRVAVLANAPDPFHKPFLENIQAAGQNARHRNHAHSDTGRRGIRSCALPR